MNAAHSLLQGAWPYRGLIGLSLVIGIAVGFLTVSGTASTGRPANGVSQERFAVLASTLLAEGEAIGVVQEHLAALGKANLPKLLAELIERYGKSSDRAKQRQADDLRNLVRAVQAGEAGIEVPAVVALEQRPPTGTAGGMTSSALSASSATPVTSVATGVIRSTPGEGVRLRAEANTTSAPIRLIPHGARVEILNVVEGQAVEGSEKRWYKVRYATIEGYVYFSLVVPGE